YLTDFYLKSNLSIRKGYIMLPQTKSIEGRVKNLICYNHKIPENFELKKILYSDENWVMNIAESLKNQISDYFSSYCYIKKNNNYNLSHRNTTRECLKFIPLDYSTLFLREIKESGFFGFCHGAVYFEKYFQSSSRCGPKFEYNHSTNEIFDNEIFDQANHYLKIFTNLQVLNLTNDPYNSDPSNINIRNIITNDTLSRLTNIRELNLYNNERITGDALSCLTNLKKINLEFNEMIGDDTLKYLTNLQELNLRENEIITTQSIRYLTNLTSITICTITCISEYGDPTYNPIFGPVLETLPKLKHLKLCSRVPIIYENLFGLTNLTRLDINEEDFLDNYRTKYKGEFSYNFNIIKSKLWTRLPKLELFSYMDDAVWESYTETRDQFTTKIALRQNLLEKMKQENPYSSWKEIDEKVEALLEEQIENNG
ncbi:MAG: hypothetical protein ACOH2E_08525, partial [Candidatus Paracaedibacter sp.]